MSDQPLPKPKNALLDLINQIIDWLIKGVGKEVVIAQAKAAQPWLNIPIISWFFTGAVGILASALDNGIKTNVDNIVIRFQGDERKAAYDSAIDQLKKDSYEAKSKEDHEKALQAAKDALDRLINKSR